MKKDLSPLIPVAKPAGLHWIIFIAFILFISRFGKAQNDTKNWYFGSYAGLTFTSNPPGSITGTLNSNEACAAISDAAGNLLFYTDGVTVWNQSHLTMSNGTGLTGNISSSQGALIVKQPGNANIYFVFTIDALGGVDGLKYSLVDMSLSSGQGSVTAKNIPVTSPCTEKLCAVKHCNGVDTWIMIHDVNANNFRAFLLSAAGVNTTAVVSSVGPVNVGLVGCMKFSPNGKKLGLASYNTSAELYDFDNATGVVSNSLSISASFVYGVEFSNDGTKFYASGGNKIYQWNLCAGSNTAIVASQYSVTASNNYGMQLASDGKIYVARGQSTLGVVNNPNITGSGCNYVDLGQSIAPNICNLGLPNIVASSLKAAPPPFTYTANNTFGCQTASFTASPAALNLQVSSCPASGYSVTGVQWTFGDPLTGAANTSTLANPSHAYSSVGGYTAQLILFYSCGAPDTIRQSVFITQPCVTVNSTSITCFTAGSATVQSVGGVGPFLFTWMPTGQTGSVATGLSPGIYTINVFDFGNNTSYSTNIVLSPSIPFTGSVSNTSVVSCFGVTNGTANIVNMSGGSGFQSYLWTTPNGTVSAPFLNNIGAGNYSVVVTDAVSGCNFTRVFSIAQPPALTLSLTASTATACPGTNIVLNGIAFGGTPSYSYSWSGGPANASYTVNPVAGLYTYTLSVVDFKNCSTSATVPIVVYPAPPLVISSVSICPLQTGTLTVTGAATYTWNNGTTGNTFTNNPTSTGQYTVKGAALGCTAIATASIILKPLPTFTLNSNSPVCSGNDLILSCSMGSIAGSSYYWNGPSAFNSAQANPTITNVNTNNSGSYNASVTAVNGCSASANTNVYVSSIPTVAASGGTACAGHNLSLYANAISAVSYSWAGPASYTAASALTTLYFPQLTASGIYTVTVTFGFGCVNTATVAGIIVPPPAPTVTLSNNGICAKPLGSSPNTLTLVLGNALTYTISTPLHIGNSNPQGPVSVLNTQPPFAPVGSTSIILLGSNGICTASSSAAFTLFANPTIGFSSSAPLICKGEPVTLTASGAVSYSLNNAVIGALTTVSPDLTTTYTVWGTDLNGCMNSATLTIAVQACGGLEELKQAASLKIYPVPATDHITLDVGEEFTNEQVEIFNDLGQVVLRSELRSPADKNLSLTGLPDGIYFLRLQKEGAATRFIIRR